MTALEAPPARPATLTTSQVEILLQLWCAAGLPPTFGYESVTLVLAVAPDQTFAAALTSVNLDDARSVETGLDALLRWRHRRFQSAP